jgi:opacity protein-like surface antigen
VPPVAAPAAAAPPAAAPAAAAPPAAAPAAAAPPAAALAARPPEALKKKKSGAPDARTGFQMHFVPLTAMSFPFGSATDERNDSLSSRYSWQWVPFDLGLGAKLIDELYVGGYLNLGVGYEGSDLKTEKRCEAGDDVGDDVSCSSVNVHAGLELRYTFAPAESASGWLGYGVGITVATQSISDAGQYKETSTVQGIDWARISGGLDFRFSRGFGMGPFGVFHVGRYTHQRTEMQDVATFSGDIADPAFHAWLTVGLRMVIFP